MFSIFKKKSAAPPASASNAAKSTSTPGYRAPEFGEKIKGMLQNLKFLYRDTELTDQLRALYSPGSFFRERTLCDATHKFGGLHASTRYLIVTPAPRDLSALSSNPAWGMCVIGANELFKVIDVQSSGRHHQITVLHVPSDFEDYFRSSDAQRFESMVVTQIREDFGEALGAAPPRELDAEWRARTASPLGFDDKGVFICVYSLPLRLPQHAYNAS